MKFRKKPYNLKFEIEKELEQIKKSSPFLSEDEKLIRLRNLRKKLMNEMIKRDTPIKNDIELKIFDIIVPNYSLS